MAVTIKQIAEYAGVSIGTVDRALHGREGVNPEVAARILKIADLLGYKPNAVARALVLRRKKIRIGFVYPVSRTPFFNEVTKGAIVAANEMSDFGIHAEFSEVEDYDIEQQLSIIDDLVSTGIHALAVAPLNNPRIAEKLSGLKEKKIPVVLVSSDLENTERMAYVGCDSYKTGRLIAGLTGVLCNGKGNVIFASPYLSILGNNLRLEGFKYTLKERYPQINLTEVREFPNSELKSYKLFLELFRSHPDTDAIIIPTFAANCITQALADSQLNRHIKVIALDLTDQVKQCIQRGEIDACITQHPYRQGYKAFKILCDFFIWKTVPLQDDCYITPNIHIYECLF